MVKKVLLGIGAVAGVAVGALLIWKVVIPFIGMVFSWMTGLI